MSLLQESFDVVLIPTLSPRLMLAVVSFKTLLSPLFFECPSSPCRDLSKYLYDDMPRQSINNDGFLPQGKRRHYLFSKLLHVPFNLPYSSLVEIPAPFGEVINGQI